MDKRTRLWPAGVKPSGCAGCPLEKAGGPFVPGYGNLAARHIIIGERPGACEDGTCHCSVKAHPRLEPFIGPSGRQIDIGLNGDRSECFITNVRKCQVAMESKETKAASIAHCVAAYLQPELDAIDAAQRAVGIEQAAISPIGADASRVLLGRGSMQKLHGTVYARGEVDAMMKAAEQFGIIDEGDGDAEAS